MASQTNITRSTKLRRSPDILNAKVGDEFALMSIGKGRYYGLNSSAARVWEMIEKPATVSDLLDKMLGKFLVDEETCFSDLVELLSKMHDAGLIEVMDETSAATSQPLLV